MNKVDAVNPMDRLCAGAIRAALQSLLSDVSRATGLPAKQLTLADLKNLSPEQFEQMELRITHVVKHHDDPDRLFRSLSDIDGPSQLREVKESAESLRNDGRLDLRPNEPLLTQNEVHVKLKAVVPFLFSAMSGKTASFTCFSSPSAAHMWFATLGANKEVMECVGYGGEIRRIPLEKLKQSGFSALPGGSDAAKNLWMNSIRPGLSASDIKQASLFVGAHMFPGFCQNRAADRMAQLMNKYPERLRNKPKAPVSQPKI